MKIEGVMKVEGVTVINSVEAGPEMVEIEEMISEISEQSVGEQSRFGFITASIEAEPATKEVVVGTEPDDQAIEGVNSVKYEYLQEE